MLGWDTAWPTNFTLDILHFTFYILRSFLRISNVKFQISNVKVGRIILPRHLYSQRKP